MGIAGWAHSHAVVDVRPRLEGLLLGQVDRHCNFAWLHGQCLPNLRRHVQEVCESLDTLGAAERMDMLEADLSEPVISYYDYGLMRERTTNADQNTVGRGLGWSADLRVGLRSNAVCSTPYDDQEAEIPLSQCGTGGGAPAHFVVAVGQPRGPLYTARTYFLQSGHEIADYEVEERLVAGADSPEGEAETEPEAEPEAVADRPESDGPMLRRLYLSTIRATHQALQVKKRERERLPSAGILTTH